jgi:hypothetical protein
LAKHHHISRFQPTQTWRGGKNRWAKFGNIERWAKFGNIEEHIEERQLLLPRAF